MTQQTLVLGAVAYDAKVVPIWDGFKAWFADQGLSFDYVLYSNYEKQVEALLLSGEARTPSEAEFMVRGEGYIRGLDGNGSESYGQKLMTQLSVARRVVILVIVVGGIGVVLTQLDVLAGIGRAGIYTSPGFANTHLSPAPAWINAYWHWIAHWTSAALPTHAAAAPAQRAPARGTSRTRDRAAGPGYAAPHRADGVRRCPTIPRSPRSR